MEIPAIHPQIDASYLPLEKLTQNTQLSEEEKVGEMARQFESLILRQILKEAQKTVIKSGFSDDSVTSEIYGDLMTSQLADSLSRSGSFGLARSLKVELSRQVLGAKPDQDKPIEN